MPFPLIPLAMAAYGIYSGVKGAADKKKADAEARALIANRPMKEISPYAKEMLADSRSRLNAVSPGLLAAYQQIQQNAANTMGYAQRNASSGAQALAIGAGANSQANAALPQLAAQQDAYSAQNRGDYYRALQGMGQEEQLVHQSDLGKYSDLTNFYLGQVGAASANQSQGMQLAATGLASMAGNDYSGLLRNNRRVITPQAGPASYMQSGYTGYGPNYQYNPLYSSYLGVR